MLELHLEEVQKLLLEKKSEYEEANDVSSLTDEAMQVVGGSSSLRSPRLGGAFARGIGGLGGLKSPKGPPVGMFGVGQSPKRGF